MAYIRKTIEPCPAYGWEGAPEFSTRIVVMANGRERRNADWAKARMKFSAQFMNIRKSEYAKVRNMFYVCQGQKNCFLWKDVLDDDASNEVFAVADGVQTVFQLIKSVTVDGFTYSRNVNAPDLSITITDDGTPVTPTIDYDRGLVTFAVAPGNNSVLRWSGPYFLWVRFAQDSLPFTLDNPDATNGQIDVIEMPPPLLVET